MTTSPLISEFDAQTGVATLTFNRPEVLNAISIPMAEAFLAAVKTLRSQPELRCIVLIGSGRAFMAGGDVASMTGTQEQNRDFINGLLVPLKDLTWHFVSNHVTDILTASDAEIIDAMKLTWKHLRVVMEASSSVPLATILKNKERFAGKRVGIIITGGNVDLDMLPWLTQRETQ